MGILDWIMRQFTRSARRKAAWSACERKESNGLTVFQNRCNEALIKALFHFPELKYGQRIEGGAEKYIEGTLPRTHIRYRIYENAAQLGDYYYLERAAFDTPELLIKAFVKMAKETIQYRDG
ncbi:MAG TPA: hypothetical protein ENI99_09780 [Sedimenticola sp.]|nr:hypothetical protein [Sedimenticola sp.]